ncbi:MAG: hypothetical protein V2A78_03460 [bacterium]
MKIIEGDFVGSNGRIINAVFQGPIFEIKSGILETTKYKIPKDIEIIKLLNKDEKRTIGQLISLILFAATILGLIIAIPLFVIWKRIDFTIGVKTKDGKKFVAQGDASDWNIVKKYIGLGSLDSF